MVYTLSLHLRESLAEFLKVRSERIRKAEDERIRLADEVSISHLFSLSLSSSPSLPGIDC